MLTSRSCDINKDMFRDTCTNNRKVKSHLSSVICIPTLCMFDVTFRVSARSVLSLRENKRRNCYNVYIEQSSCNCKYICLIKNINKVDQHCFLFIVTQMDLPVLIWNLPILIWDLPKIKAKLTGPIIVKYNLNPSIHYG